MQLDNTLVEIITTLQKKVNNKYNIDISFDTIHDVVSIQMQATSLAFSRKIPITWKGFLKFIWTDRVNRNIETKTTIAEIDSDKYDLTAKQREYFRYLTVVNNSKKLNELRSQGINSKPLSKEEVLAIPTRTRHFVDFKPLYKKKTK
jgi:L-2-hydroxyglutarate oxidase LhgO